MRKDICEILSKLGFENDPDESFRVVRNDIAVSLSTISLSISNIPGVQQVSNSLIPKSTTSIFLIEKIKDSLSQKTSDDIITEVFINHIDYDLIRNHILRFFQSDIREKSLTYLLDK
jgi:hypothetical protein